MGPYQYEPLSSPASQIRLLELLPGHGIIQCRLKVTSLGEAKSTYEPISYCWKAYTREHWLGSTYKEKKKQKRIRVRIDGADFYINENLHGALRQMRLESTVRVLWADAICINQTDETEKSAQVAIMGDIYRNGRTTLAWLGEADHRTRKAFSKLGSCAYIQPDPSLSETGSLETSSLSQSSMLSRNSSPSGDSSLIGHPSLSSRPEHTHPGLVSRNSQSPGLFRWIPALWESLCEQRLLVSVESILRRPYFRRAWVVQEIAKSDSVLVMCGKFTIKWNSLANGLSSTYFKPSGGDPFVALDDIWLSLYDYDLVEVAMKVSPTKAQDPRDKLYGILGLVPDHLMTTAVTVDYNKSPEEVFHEFTKGSLLSSTTLAVLSMSYGCSPLKPKNVPSWVWNPQPDDDEPYHSRLSLPRSTSEHYQATRGSKSQLEFRGSMLGLRGIVLQTVTRLTSVWNPVSRPNWPFHVDDPSQFLQQALGYFEYRAISGIAEFPDDSEDAERLRNIIFRTAWPHSFLKKTNSPLSDQIAQTQKLMKFARFDSEIVKRFGRYVPREDNTISFWTRVKLLVAIATLSARCTFGNPGVEEFQQLLPSFSRLNNRRLVRTDGGDIALCPKETEVNDKLVLLQGSDVPFILRPVGDHWQIVGECYVHVLMDGSGWDESRCEMLWIE